MLNFRLVHQKHPGKQTEGALGGKTTLAQGGVSRKISKHSADSIANYGEPSRNMRNSSYTGTEYHLSSHPGIPAITLEQNSSYHTNSRGIPLNGLNTYLRTYEALSKFLWMTHPFGPMNTTCHLAPYHPSPNPHSNALQPPCCSQATFVFIQIAALNFGLKLGEITAVDE